MLGIKEDSRNVLERLRRSDLYKVCRANNIPFQEGTSAELLRGLVENANIDVLDPNNGVEYETVRIQNEDGSFHEEIYPTVKPHATQGKEIDYDKYITKSEDVDTSKVSELEARLEAALKVIEGLTKDKINIDPEELNPDYSSMKMPQLRSEAKKKGLVVSPKTKKDELIEMLNG